MSTRNNNLDDQNEPLDIPILVPDVLCGIMEIQSLI